MAAPTKGRPRTAVISAAPSETLIAISAVVPVEPEHCKGRAPSALNSKIFRKSNQNSSIGGCFPVRVRPICDCVARIATVHPAKRVERIAPLPMERPNES